MIRPSYRPDRSRQSWFRPTRLRLYMLTAGGTLTGSCGACGPVGADMDAGQEDVEAIEEAVSGDMKSLARVLRAVTPRLQQYVQRHFPPELGGSVEPADVLQDVCFEACRLISGFRPRGEDSFYRWLVTIARHRLVDLLRVHRTRVKLGRAWTDTTGDPVANLLEELAVYKRTPSRSAASHELMRTIEEAIGRLSTEHRQAVTLRHIEGLTVSETARQMGRSEEAVYWLTCRALQALRADLQSASDHL
jgi:RNA polymerase sigma-70 factor, ECF subfamily